MAKGNRQEVELKGIYITKSCDRRSTDVYNAKHDRITITLDKGEREIWRDYGFDNATVIAMVREAIEKKKAEQGK